MTFIRAPGAGEAAEEDSGGFSMGTIFIPQMGQSPGLSEVMAGCIGHW
jgi:hypothetical protein